MGHEHIQVWVHKINAANRARKAFFFFTNNASENINLVVFFHHIPSEKMFGHLILGALARR